EGSRALQQKVKNHLLLPPSGFCLIPASVSTVCLPPYEPDVPEPTTRADLMKCRPPPTSRFWSGSRNVSHPRVLLFPQIGFPSLWMTEPHRSCCGFLRAGPKWLAPPTPSVRIPTGRSATSTRRRCITSASKDLDPKQTQRLVPGPRKALL
ncbi:unnamed protein product, partial [Tetraodon nigroviridis]